MFITTEEMIAAIKALPTRPVERLEAEVIPQGWSVTRGKRDHYYFREVDTIEHIAVDIPKKEASTCPKSARGRRNESP